MLFRSVQSFRPETLSELGRSHSVDDVRSAYRDARKARFASVGIDLIFGNPGQTTDDWRADLERAVTFLPDHVSAYALTIEPATALGRAVARALRGANVAFLANHGTVAVGPTMDVALQRMESLEQGARIVLAARILGGHGTLNAGELRALEAAWRAGAGRGTTRGRRTRT